MLDRQYHLYSVDTGHFYSGREAYLHRMNFRYRRERRFLKNRIGALSDALRGAGVPEAAVSELARGRDVHGMDGYGAEAALAAGECARAARLVRHKSAKAAGSKAALLRLVKNRADQNDLAGGRDHARRLRGDALRDTDVVSAFESSLSRALGIREGELTRSLVIVQVYYFDVFRDLFFHGFLFGGERYRYLTSSAGQIRRKKAVFIRESDWRRVEGAVTCGLTEARINAAGGCNANKYLAYLALANSATDAWRGFDPRKAVVVDDFETVVRGEYDLVDETDYSVRRAVGGVPVNHTDGAGMVLPSVSGRAFMFRAPFIKGLLCPFDFMRFIRERGCSPVIRDIYGRERDLAAEGVEVVFTRSQFKMWKYYGSWEEYAGNFERYGCEAGICNVEEEYPRNARMNYQMLQTLTDMTDEEADEIAAPSAARVRDISSSPRAMMRALGVVPGARLNPFQESLRMYPALLNDPYARDALRDAKDGMVRRYRGGKLEVRGKYAFILPDFYAACERWFLHEEDPRGLLADGEAYCSLWPGAARIDCLRSPHLYREHAVRDNVAAEYRYGDRAPEVGEWLCTGGLYTSCHDLISRMLQFDVDGDKALVVADPAVVRVAERNMEGVVPLYYNMRKAGESELCPRALYDGLIKAFTGGNIGIYSNGITKIWNGAAFDGGTEEDRAGAEECVKMLCCQNNFVIDYAKTLYKPEFPESVRKRISKYAAPRPPAFFEYAKGVGRERTEPPNGSTVNRLCARIRDYPIRTRRLGLGGIDRRVMMSDPDARCTDGLAALYDRLSRRYRHMVNMKDERDGNLSYVASELRARFAETGRSESEISDMLVEYLYGRGRRYKQVLWFCYGKYIAENIRRNTGWRGARVARCPDCGDWFEADALGRPGGRCPNCEIIARREYKKAAYEGRKKRGPEREPGKN